VKSQCARNRTLPARLHRRTFRPTERVPTNKGPGRVGYISCTSHINCTLKTQTSHLYVSTCPIVRMASTNPNIDIESQDASRKDDDTYQSTILPASAIDFDPEPHKRLFRQFANPAPLGLCGFALTTFVLSLINVQARSVTTPNIVIGLGI